MIGDAERGFPPRFSALTPTSVETWLGWIGRRPARSPSGWPQNFGRRSAFCCRPGFDVDGMGSGADVLLQCGLPTRHWAASIRGR
jgi:hypothetical protein